MISFLPDFVRGVLGLSLFILNTAFWCVFIYTVALFKLLVPIKAFRRWCTNLMVAFGEVWIDGNDLLMTLLHKIKIDVQGVEGIDPAASYLVWSNHQSWVDITMIQHVFNRRIPFLRFFLKQELLYVPLLGIAWWALDFPFMRRYSKAFLDKHPEMRGKDLETTIKACEKFRGTQISVLNFLEGTRFTKDKHAAQKSPYAHLLKPKTGGIAFVIDAMGSQFKSLVDVTIYYPGGAGSMWDLFSGRVRHVVIRVRTIEIPRDLLNGNYLEDDAYRDRFQAWIRELWLQKDELISKLKTETETGTP